MNRLRTPLALILSVWTTAILLSCDARKDVTASEPGVWVMPRFAAGASVPTSTRTVVGRLSAKGRPDTVRTVGYQSGGTIEFGTLPPQTAFRLTLTGLDSLGKALWWSHADDTTGSSPVKDVLMTLAPVPLAAGSLLPTTSVWFKGDTLPVPAGAVYTVDGSDPRTSLLALPVLDPKGLAVDSNDIIRIAVRVPRDSALGQPELWSPVETYTFGIDAQDTITSLDTLMLTHWRNRGDSILYEDQNPDSAGYEEHYNFTIIPGVMAAGSNVRFDTIPTGMSFGLTTLALRIFSIPRSPRATIRAMGLVVVPDSFFEIPFPEDSVVDVTVENNGRRNAYVIHLVPKRIDSPNKTLQGLAATTAGLRQSALDDKSWVMSIPFDQTIFSIIPTLPPSMRLRSGNALWKTGDTIPLSVPLDTTFSFLVVDSLGDPAPAGPYTLQVIHAPRTLTFRDTTWGVPWRDVAYDTLVDVRNGRKYRTVMVGNARWMAENLSFRRDSSFCPAVTDSCSKYGRWYRWAAAADTTPAFDATSLASTTLLKGVCPSGWHLPSEAEWRTLVELLGTSKSGTLLRSVGSSWNQGSGEDSVGFRAMPAGYRYLDGGYPGFFNTLGQSTDAYFWTATQSSLNATRASSVHISGAAPAIDFVSTSLKSNAFSVRCVEDTPAP